MNSQVNFAYDAPPPRKFCPEGWTYQEFATREGATIAADYWEERGAEAIARWLRIWAEVSPDEIERLPKRRSTGAICAWGENTKWAKRFKARQERAAARQNPLAADAYHHRGIW